MAGRSAGFAAVDYDQDLIARLHASTETGLSGVEYRRADA